MAGISILRRLLMKQAMKESAPFQHEGIMSISRSLSGNVDAKVKRWVKSAKRQGQDIDKMSEQEIKYLIELNKPKPPKVYSNEEAYKILSRFANKNRRGEVIKADFGKPFAEEIVTVERVIADIKKMKPIESMKEANKVLRGEGRYKSLSKADREKIVGDESVTDHIFERNIEPEDFAQGGRTGLSYLLAEDTNERVPFKLGGIDKMRRAFLKAIGAGAATAGAAKTGLFGLLKGSKSAAVKDLTQVPIGDPAGMPPWFKPLVNRVIKEGDDVTKQFATKEREIVHTKKLDEFDEVTVRQDLDTGNVRVEYEGSGNMGEQSVQLEYKASEEIPLKGGKGSVKTTEEFSAVEAEPRVMNWDGDIEWDVENVVSEVKDLMSDTSKLKQYATNKPLSKKELAIAKQKQEKVKNMNENQVAQGEFIEEKYGPAPDDVPDHIPSGYDKMKSGGRAGYVLGGKVGMGILKLLKDKKKLKAAYDDIFPTDDYKYDAEMVAESLVENNPKVFRNRLYEDLTDRERMAVYGAALDEASANFAKALKFKRSMKSMEETGTINISDDAVAEEFTNFMKETDPEGHAKIQKVVEDANQQLELKRFKTKGRKPNADGGLIDILKL